MNLLRIAVVALFGVAVWGLCGSVIFIGRTVTSNDNTLIIHAIAVPVIAAAVSTIYYRRFGYTSPLRTATIFTAIAIFLDASVIAPFVEKSPAMFINGMKAVLGTWLPFALIFASTYVTGRIARRKARAPSSALA